MLENLQAQDFQPYKDCLCKLTIAEGVEAEIELTEITETPKGAMSADSRIPFSLIFKIAEEHAFNSNHCHFHHPKLGILENLLITRILPPDPRDKTAWYQIIFA